jgi:outer membrane protein TolC
LLQRLVETAAAEAEALRKRAELGDVRRPDQLLAEVERSRNQAILQSEQARLQGQLAELESLTGLNLGDTDLPAMAIEPELPAAPIDVPPMAATALAEANLLRSSEQRLREEAKPPLTLMVTTARGDFGEYRLGAGVLWTLPSTRRNQAERARTLATARAAEVRADVVRTQVAVQVRNLLREWKQLHEARTALVAQSLPGAHAAIRAAEATVLAGKGERTTVWLARRTALELELRALELKERQWAIAGLLTGWLTPPSAPTTSPEDTDPYGPEEK